MGRLGPDTAFDRRWYIYAWLVAFWIPVGLFGYASATFPKGSVPQTVGFLGVAFVASITVFAYLYSILGYYLDAKLLNNIESEWVPKWWVWTLCHVLLSPLITSPVYLVVRTRHTGVPWGRDQAD